VVERELELEEERQNSMYEKQIPCCCNQMDFGLYVVCVMYCEKKYCEKKYCEKKYCEMPDVYEVHSE
jgi:hypothetical protein